MQVARLIKDVPDVADFDDTFRLLASELRVARAMQSEFGELKEKFEEAAAIVEELHGIVSAQNCRVFHLDLVDDAGLRKLTGVPTWQQFRRFVAGTVFPPQTGACDGLSRVDQVAASLMHIRLGMCTPHPSVCGH